MTLSERLLRHVTILSDSLCWLWEGCTDRKGYGYLNHYGKTLKAHRVSFELFVEEILPGNHVLHKCDIKPCINPNHLYQGTNRDNVDDRLARQPNSFITNGKLPLETILLIIRDKRIYSEIAESFNTSYSSVQAIKAGKTWKNVSREQLHIGRPLKEFCPRGHPYDDVNTYIRPGDGARVCWTCCYLAQKVKLPEHLRKYVQGVDA
jgi:hypothetical protein